MRYVNEDIVLRGDEAKQFVYNLHHPNVAKIVEENRRCLLYTSDAADEL